MRVRHRLSKLLVRQGRVYSGGKAWNGVHETWLRRQRFDDPHTAAAFDHHFDAVLSATAARDRLDEQIVTVAASPRWADQVDRLGCLRGISALTGPALTVESVTGPGSPAPRSAPTSAWFPPSTPPGHHGCKVRSPRPATLTFGGCRSSRPGTIERPTAIPDRRCGPAGPRSTPHSRIAGTPAIDVCTSSGAGSTNVGSRTWRPTSRLPASWPAGAGHWRR
jgi:hypothetical protein